MSKLNIKEIRLLLFAICIVTAGGLTFWYFMVQEPVGDDVISFFSNSISFYLDDEVPSLGPKMTSFAQAINLLKKLYFKWSGRILGYFFDVLTALIPKWIKAIIGTLVITGNTIMILNIIYEGFKKTIQHPFSFVFLFTVMYWYRPLGFYEYMWTMLSVYEIPLFVCLVFCNFILLHNNTGSKKEVCVAIVLGFLAGISNETCVFITFSILGINWLMQLYLKNTSPSSIKTYLGFFLGTAINVFSPGNFNRLTQSHDSRIKNKSVIERLKSSIASHKDTLIPSNTLWRVVVGVLIIVTIFLVIRYIKNYRFEGAKKIWRCSYVYIITGCLSVLLWGVMPGTPTYGLSFWIGIVYITLFKIIECTKPVLHNNVTLIKEVIISVLLSVCFLYNNLPWLWEYTKVSVERNHLIQEAVQREEMEVKVPLYSSDSLGPITTDLLNDQSQYDSEHYIQFYNIRVIIDNKGN